MVGPKAKEAPLVLDFLVAENLLGDPLRSDQCDVQPDECEGNGRQYADVEDEKPRQRIRPDCLTAAQQVRRDRPHEGQRFNQVGRDRRPPEAELLVNERVPSEPESERRQQQADAHHPV